VRDITILLLTHWCRLRDEEVSTKRIGDVVDGKRAVKVGTGYLRTPSIAEVTEGVQWSDLPQELEQLPVQYSKEFTPHCQHNKSRDC
jgi:hypothetical protein